MSDLISQNLNMVFTTPKGETVHALKDLNFTVKKGVRVKRTQQVIMLVNG